MGPHPVQFEAIGDENSDFGKVLKDVGAEWFDPGVELLLGELLRELIDAALPQTLANVETRRQGRIGRGSLRHFL